MSYSDTIELKECAKQIHHDLSDLNEQMFSKGRLGYSTAWCGGVYTWTVEAWQNLTTRAEMARRISDRLEHLEPRELLLAEDMTSLRGALREYLDQIGEFGTPTPFGIVEGPRITDDTRPLNLAKASISRLLATSER